MRSCWRIWVASTTPWIALRVSALPSSLSLAETVFARDCTTLLWPTCSKALRISGWNKMTTMTMPEDRNARKMALSISRSS